MNWLSGMVLPVLLLGSGTLRAAKVRGNPQGSAGLTVGGGSGECVDH